MGTKNQPGKFDCYAAAEPDEPMFTLLGRDPTAPLVVYVWRAFYAALNPDKRDKLAEAKDCAEAMGQWCVAKGRSVSTAAQVRMLRHGLRFLTGCVASLEVGDESEHLAGMAVDGMADAQGYLESLESRLEAE